MADVPQQSVPRGASQTKAESDDIPFLRTKIVRNIIEKAIAFVLFSCAAFSIFVTIGIIVSLFGEAIGFFARPEVSLIEYLTTADWAPLAAEGRYGVLPLINGTFMIAFISSIIAIPLGVGSAILLSEYASERVRNALKPLLEILAGIPTVVYGYFALSFVTPQIERVVEAVNSVLGTELEVGFFNALSASIVVGIMIIPMVASLSEDAMRSVPRSLREGAFALGATKAEVSRKVVVPAALSGIIASFIIAVSRAIGETMAVTIAAGAQAQMTLNPLESVMTMTAFIVNVALGDATAGSIASQSIFAVGATLFLMTFVMNVISSVVLDRFREEYE